MADSEKNISWRLISRGKNLARKYLAKKISFMSYNAGKKTYTAVCQEKEFFHQRVEKEKLVHKPNHPQPPSKDK